MSTATPAIDVSVIAPAFNEIDNVEPLIERIREVFAPTGLVYEAVIVDDCSTDGTREKLLALAAKYPWLRVIRLDKNSGQTAAMDAGFRHARGAGVWDGGCGYAERSCGDRSAHEAPGTGCGHGQRLAKRSRRQE